MLYITILLFVFLFLLSCYLEYQRSIYEKSSEKTEALSQGAMVGSLVWAFFKSFGCWLLCALFWGWLLGVAISGAILMEVADEYFWHTHTTAIACAMLCLMAWSIWNLQLKSTTKRLTAFDSSYHVQTIRTLLICCVLLTVVPYFAMHLASNDSFPRSSCHIPAKQYEGNGSVFGQILQEVANTDGHVQSAQGAIQDDIHHLYHQLRDLIIAGFTISTLVLGLIIIYFTRKCGIQRVSKEEPNQALNTSESAEN